MDPSWFPTNNNRPSYDGAEKWLLMAMVAQVTSIVLPSRLLRLTLGLPCFFYCAFQIRTHTANDSGADYITFLNIFWTFLRWVDWAILHDPRPSFWRANEAPQRKREDLVKTRSLIEELKWALSLCTTYRGVGWNWQVKSIDEIPLSMSRRKFVAIQTLKSIRLYLIGDFVAYYLKYKAFPNRIVPDVAQLPLLDRVVVGWALATDSVAAIHLIHYITAIFTVAIGLYDPQDWPPVFGSWRRLYTVRKAWGYCWHQYLRRLVEVFMGSICNLFGFRNGTLKSRYVKLYGAFVISAIIHHVGALNVPWVPGVKHQAIFFLVQPFIITFEDFVIHTGKKFGIRFNGFTCTLGYLWVLLVFSFTLPLMAKFMFDCVTLDGGRRKGNPLLVYSVADRLLG